MLQYFTLITNWYCSLIDVSLELFDNGVRRATLIIQFKKIGPSGAMPVSQGSRVNYAAPEHSDMPANGTARGQWSQAPRREMSQVILDHTLSYRCIHLGLYTRQRNLSNKCCQELGRKFWYSQEMNITIFFCHWTLIATIRTRDLQTSYIFKRVLMSCDSITVAQTPDSSECPLFRFPLQVTYDWRIVYNLFPAILLTNGLCQYYICIPSDLRRLFFPFCYWKVVGVVDEMMSLHCRGSPFLDIPPLLTGRNPWGYLGDRT